MEKNKQIYQMESKIPKLGKPLSRWKRIVIHDDNNQITSIHDLDVKQRLIDYKKKPKRKIEYRKTLVKKFIKYIESDEYLKIRSKHKKLPQIYPQLDIKMNSQLEKHLNNVHKTEKSSQNKTESNFPEMKNDQQMSLCDNFFEDAEMLLRRYCLQQEDGHNTESDDFSSFIF